MVFPSTMVPLTKVAFSAESITSPLQWLFSVSRNNHPIASLLAQTRMWSPGLEAAGVVELQILWKVAVVASSIRVSSIVTNWPLFANAQTSNGESHTGRYVGSSHAHPHQNLLLTAGVMYCDQASVFSTFINRSTLCSKVADWLPSSKS